MEEIKIRFEGEEEELNKILKEVDRSNQNYKLFNSPHEALGVILEEYEELKEEIKKRPERTDWLAMEKEARHLAAMCIKLIISIREGTIENYLV